LNWAIEVVNRQMWVFTNDILGMFFQQDSLKGGKWSNGAEMTEEEALAEQQRMFAEARARMNGGVAPRSNPTLTKL
jgi:hypothetical protein